MCKQSGNCELENRVNSIDERVTALESSVKEMRQESQAGFTSLTNAINSLGHDFGQRMNAMDTRLVEEKVSWGRWLRSSICSIGSWLGKWGGIIILAALGMSNSEKITTSIIKFFHQT